MVKSKSFVSPSIHDIQVSGHIRVGWNNSKIIPRLKVNAWAEPNIGDLTQREHPQN